MSIHVNTFMRVVIENKNIEKCLKVMSKIKNECSGIDPAKNKYNDIEEAFNTWGYDCFIEENGNAAIGERLSEKWWNDDILWKKIAKYVTPDSFIEFSGEEGEEWKYIFGNGKMIEYERSKEWIKKEN
ncbi:MAG: hypothetical protein AABY32_01250 [Nanoarchaeota archaeon]